ncbi:MAG TPA: hypothetical protein VLK66_27145 [Longimicrobium sp.]|nr:hypothetical protein [Longimicrobium sp.]HSU17814.1 hypothetical protein [Longimicrobium sp.]
MTFPKDDGPSRGELILYQTEDGRSRVECHLDGESLWLSQAAMAELHQTSPQNINIHLRSLYAAGEIVESATRKEYLQVQFEGTRQVTRTIKHYNLDAILAVGSAYARRGMSSSAGGPRNDCANIW